jgi:hypothetical protein
MEKGNFMQFFAFYRRRDHLSLAVRPEIVGEQILAVSTHLARSKSVGKQGRYPSVKVSNKPETADYFYVQSTKSNRRN